MDITIFDDTRPYYDHEIPAAIERISANKYLPLMCIFPDLFH